MTRSLAGVLVLFCCAAALYFYRLSALGFVTDEIYHGIAARAILHDGVPRLPNGGLYMKGALFSYLGALFSALFANVEFGVRFASGLCVLATGWVIHLTLRDRHGQWAGVLGAFVWLFHPWSVEFARWGRLYTLAALLFTTSTFLLLRYCDGGRRVHLLGACAVLALGTSVYPLGVCWALAVVVAWVLRNNWSRTRQLWSLGTLAVAITLVVVALLAWGDGFAGLTRRHSPISLVEITGNTGREGGAAFRNFFGVSYAYPKFFLSELFAFALSLTGLAFLGIRRSRDPILLSRTAVLLMCSVGVVAFTTVFHLQRSAMRYLFPAFPVMVIGSVTVWAALIEQYLSRRKATAYLSVAAVCCIWFLLAGVARIPFRQYADPYPNPLFGPSPKLTQYWDFKSPALYVRAHAEPDDVVMAAPYAFYFFYAEREPHYAVGLGRKAKKSGALAAYMSKTREIGSCKSLAKVLDRTQGRSVWLPVHEDAALEQCLTRLSRKYPLQVVYQAERDAHAKVFLRPGAS